MIALKLIVALLFLAVLVTLLHAAAHGIRYWRLKPENPSLLRSHTWWLWLTFWLTMAAVVMVEIMVQVNGGVQDKVLIVTHLRFAIPFLVTLILVLVFSAIRWPKMHGTFFTVSTGTYLGTLITGFVLLWNA